MKHFLILSIVSALFLTTLKTEAAPSGSASLSSPAQVSGILARVVDEVAAHRDVYFHQGDYQRVIALDRILTQADPHFLDGYATGGWLMDSLGDRKDAEAYYKQGIANNPHTEESYFNLAFFYFTSLHDYRTAAKAFREAASQPNARINDWKMMAHSYERIHDYDRAVAAWRSIKRRWPNGVAVDINLSRALAMQQAARVGTPKP